MMRWLAKLNLRKRPLSGNEPVELSYLLSGTGVLVLQSHLARRSHDEMACQAQSSKKALERQ